MGVFNDIKSKLGFSGEQQDQRYDDRYYDDAEYGDDYSDEVYDQAYDSYGDSSHDRGSTSRRSSYSGAQNEGGSPRLVSIDDVRARTQIPESLNRDPLPERQVTSTQGAYIPAATNRSSQYGAFRKVERAADYMRSTETSDVKPLHSSSRSSEYDSTFPAATLPSAAVPSVAHANSAYPTSSRSSYDPYETFSGSGVTSHNPSRSLTVLKPISYAEVERIAKILKAGDVVVLVLANTQDQLAKRILDFSFGVSSALDASVESIADKVFVINRGRALSEEEIRDLRTKV